MGECLHLVKHLNKIVLKWRKKSADAGIVRIKHCWRNSAAQAISVEAYRYSISDRTLLDVNIFLFLLLFHISWNLSLIHFNMVNIVHKLKQTVIIKGQMFLKCTCCIVRMYPKSINWGVSAIAVQSNMLPASIDQVCTISKMRRLIS